MTAVAAASKSQPQTSAPELITLELVDLVESPWNPRTHYDPQQIDELAGSLRTQGQLTPLLVRPRKDGRFEIAAGHRRFRAAKKAGLGELLAVVRDMDDATFTEALNVENLERADLHPLEEAQGFKDLMTRAGYDVAKIAARIGRSEKYVYDRVKLLQLTPEAKKLFQAGKFEAGHAILLARLSPAEQKKVIATDRALFESDYGHDELDLHDPVKPRSVRELESYIDDHIRQRPEAIDSFLFPETAQQLAAAKEEELKVVHITHDYLAKDDVRRADNQRVYGSASWKRADGKEKSKRCDYAALGVVVAGYGRGEAFAVCVRRDKCEVHWKKKKRRAAASPAREQSAYEAQLEREHRERDREDSERKRWEKATPALFKELRTKVAGAAITPTSPVWRWLVKWATRRYRNRGELQPGKTAETLARYIAYQVATAELSGYSWRPWTEFPALLKTFGIDAKKIVDQVAPKPKPEPAKKPAKKKAKK